jgi:small subunit ribosomal protein S1
VQGIEGLLRQNDISYKKYAPFKQYFHVDQEVEVLILEIDKEAKRLSLGIKQMYEDPWVWAGRELEKDMVVRGIVTSLTNFGAFVELKEGLEGLIHTSELAWSKKPPHPKEVLKKGQEVDSVVLDIDLERKRLSLGLKQLLPNPWDSLSSNVRKGNVLEGKVTGITKYGVFVEVENGIEGLIHIGDLTWNEKAKDPVNEAGIKKGQVVKYLILDVNQDAQRISCGLKQLSENPYDALRKKYPTGVIVEGKIKSIVSFGVFVEIEPGFEGLVHVSQIPDGKNLKLEEIYKVGETIKTVLLKIEPEQKKISLSIKDFDKAVEKEEMARYIKQDDSPSSESMGSFINLNKN